MDESKWPTTPFGVAWMIGFGEGASQYGEYTEIYRASYASTTDGSYGWFAGSLTSVVSVDIS